MTKPFDGAGLRALVIGRRPYDLLTNLLLPHGNSMVRMWQAARMKSTFIMLIGTVIIGAADPAPANLNSASLVGCTGGLMPTLDQLAHDAVSEDKTTAANAISALRTRGPEGLRALFIAHADALKQHSAANTLIAAKPPDDSWVRLKAALDAVGQQHDCYASQLYWYTDLDQAKVAARESRKPILSLRLLGRLDEEFSCANSRFFRTTLYANSGVAQFLRNNFVLHWKSVRPVPRITIDFGDGRKIERTITGNSIHYVLDSDGRVIDALPGLYGPREFMNGLTLANYAANQAGMLSGAERDGFLTEFHRDRIAAVSTQWADDIDQIGGHTPPLRKALRFEPYSELPPSAVLACSITLTKAGVERPFWYAMTPRADADRAKLESTTDDDMWAKIAALPAHTVYLDAGSRELIRAKNPSALAAGRVAVSKSIVETPLVRTIQNLQRSIAEDTVRNEYLLHTKIHEWLANGSAPADADPLNAKAYAELFLTPDSDPWLGLVPRDTFTALENDGLVQPTGKLPNAQVSARPSF